jgi:hypothetical protein
MKCIVSKKIETASRESDEGCQIIDLDPRKDDAFCGL